MVTSQNMPPSQAETFDRLLDVIAEEVVARYLEELEGAEACGMDEGATE